MSWSKVDNPKPAKGGALSRDAVRCRVRTFKSKRGERRWIGIQIGEGVARSLAAHGERHRCHLLVGSGEDEGAVAITIDDQAGAFELRKGRNGIVLTIPELAAAAKFRTDFAAFDRDVTVVPRAGQPPFVTFEAKPMLNPRAGKAGA